MGPPLSSGNKVHFCKLSLRSQLVLPLLQVDLKHIDQEKGSNVVDVGIDLKEYYLSVEWDILAVPATR